MSNPVMTPEARQALTTLKALADELTTCRRPQIEVYDRYYRGLECRLHYASDKFKEYFESRYRKFSDNWVREVADAPVERLEVTGIRPHGSDLETDSDLWQDWLRTEADYFSAQAFLEAVIGRRAFALVWGDREDRPRITWEHPHQAIVSYDPETYERRAGLKLWCDDDLEYATLYTPDAVWKWQRPRMAERDRTETGLYVTSEVGGWVPRVGTGDDKWPIVNPLGVVPLVELPNKPRLLGEPLSDVDGAVAMQNAINLLWAYLFNAADYASFKQRIILGNEMPTVPILDDQGQVVGKRPVDLQEFAVNRVMLFENPNAKVAEWGETDLQNYTRVLEVCVAHLAAQSRTPPHYLLLGNGLVNVSAEGMKVAETGLAMRTKEKTQSFGRGVREVFRLCSLVRGDERKAEAVATGTVTWRDVELRSDAQVVDAAQKLRAMGYPLEWISRRLGMSPPEIEEVMEMIRAERDSDPLALIAQTDRGIPAEPEEPAEPVG